MVCQLTITMSPKPVIAIDIDDVLSSSAVGFVEWSNKKYGTHLKPEDYQEHWAEMWKIDLDETFKRAQEFHEDDIVGSYNLIDGALDVLKKLKDKYTLILITSRRMSIKPSTLGWINAHYPNIFEDCVFAGFFDADKPDLNHLKMTKAELAKNLKADYLIDDQLKHIEATAEIGIKGLLFGDYSWNQKDDLPKNVKRVKDWNEILNYFV